MGTWTNDIERKEARLLELRPNCEWCDKDLPPASQEAMICTYECTFCRTCVEAHLRNVCPNCGGGFCPRPIRPHLDRRPGVSLRYQMPSTTRVHLSFDKAEIADFVRGVAHIPPLER